MLETLDLVSGTAFHDWTGGRTAPPIGTNAGATPLAFQNWRRFKEAFAPELIQRAIGETASATGRRITRVFDPFAGSGTTALASQFLGALPISIEVNPYLADLIEAKLHRPNVEHVCRRLAEVLETGHSIDPLSYYAGAPATFFEPGVNHRYLFSYAVGARLAGLLKAILRTRDAGVRRILRVLLGTAALEVCHATVSGKGRRYRANWESLSYSAVDLDRAFVNAVELALFDLSRFGGRSEDRYQLIRGDSRVHTATIEEVDLAIFSPPYPNSFDYTDVYNIELWALGYLRSGRDNSDLRNSTLRSHVQLKRDFSTGPLPPQVRKTVAKLKRANGLWNRHIPDMVAAYFDDLSNLMGQVRSKLREGGRIYLVVGDSRYAGVDVPVAAHIRDMAPQIGFKVLDFEAFRSMRASPQQGGRAELPETLLVLGAY